MSEETVEEIDLKKMIVIDHQSLFTFIWKCIDIFCCLMSGYFYAWIGCFGIKDDQKWLKDVNLALEVIFTISILLRFITDYIPLGETTPVKNISLISEKYL